MKKFSRYVVVGSRRHVEHGYSTQLGASVALSYATDCADHPVMKGRVFGESDDGSRQLVYTSPLFKEKGQENEAPEE